MSIKIIPSILKVFGIEAAEAAQKDLEEEDPEDALAILEKEIAKSRAPKDSSNKSSPNKSSP